MRLPVYLDNHATTPLDPRVLEAMLPYLREDFGNASSIDHAYGARAAEAVEMARRRVAKSIGAADEEIIFTSGATESDNLALMGLIPSRDLPSSHFVTSAIEHKAVLDSFRRLEDGGAKVTYLPVDSLGMVSARDLETAVTPRTKLVSIMWANNEVGTIQDIATLSDIAHRAGVPFHTDAAQAVGHVPVDVEAAEVDMMSFSGHKTHGPKGIGGLYVRRLERRIRLTPLLMGGGQERGLRSGTLNVPGIVGLGEALALAARELGSEGKRLRGLRDELQRRLLETPDVQVNGNPDSRLPNNLNLRIKGVDGKALIGAVAKSVAFSASSACATQTVEPSHVLLALGLTPREAHSCVRFGLGRFTTSEEISFAASEMSRFIPRLRLLA